MALQRQSKAFRTNGPWYVFSTILTSDANAHHPPFFQFWKLYQVVCTIQAVSRWVWRDDTGASIMLHLASSWDDYVKIHPEAKPFYNKGWCHFTKVSLIMPSTAVGANIFYPTVTQDEGHSSPPPSEPNSSQQLDEPSETPALNDSDGDEVCSALFILFIFHQC